MAGEKEARHSLRALQKQVEGKGKRTGSKPALQRKDKGGPLGFAGHGAGEEKNGAAEHQRIGDVIEAEGEAGAIHEADGDIDGQLHEENGRANAGRSQAGFLANEQRNARDGVKQGREVGPKGVAQDVGGSQASQGNAGDTVGVQELLEAVKEHGNCDEVARDGGEDVRDSLAPPWVEAGSESESSAAEGQLAEHERQRDAVARVMRPGWGVHEHDEKEKGQGDQTGRETRLNPGHQAEPGGDETSADEIGPEEMPGNPARNDGGDFFRQGEMLGAEGREGSGVKWRTEEDELVEASRLLPIAPKKDYGQPDDKNGSKNKGRPEHLAWNRDVSHGCRGNR
jgi:hypothetical protein